MSSLFASSQPSRWPTSTIGWVTSDPESGLEYWSNTKCTTIPLGLAWFFATSPGPSNSKSNIETFLESSYHLSQVLPARWGTSLKSDAIAVLVSGLVSIAIFCLLKKALMCHRLKAMQKVSAKENSWFRNCAKKFEHVSNEPQCVSDTRRIFWDFYKHRQLCWQCEWCCLRSELLHHQPPPKRRSMKHTMFNKMGPPNYYKWIYP